MTTLKVRVIVDADITGGGAISEESIGRSLHRQMNNFVLDGGLEREGTVTDLRAVEIATFIRPEGEPPMHAVERARETLKAAYPGLEPIANTEAITEVERVQHLLWMCDQIERYLEVGGRDEREKAMRWVGFVQGSFWLLGLRSINAMREDVRQSV